LAFLGREPSDPTLIRNDAAADWCAAGPHRLTRGECNEAAGRRKGPRVEWCPRNASERGVPVSAGEREPGRGSPKPRDYATKDHLVDLEGPRAYKAAYLGGQNGNSGYYAHPMKLYRTPWEQKELAQIRQRFPRRRVVSPASYEGHPEKLRDTVGFCLRLVEGCEIVVFRRFFGKVTAGVRKEVNHALRLGKPVYEIQDGKFKAVSKRLTYISRLRTNRLYNRFDRGDFLRPRGGGSKF